MAANLVKHDSKERISHIDIDPSAHLLIKKGLGYKSVQLTILKYSMKSMKAETSNNILNMLRDGMGAQLMRVKDKLSHTK